MIYLQEHLENLPTVISQIFLEQQMEYRILIKMDVRYAQKYNKMHGKSLEHMMIISNELIY